MKQFFLLFFSLESTRANELNEEGDLETTTTQKLIISDEITLSTIVATRLDLPMSQRLLDQDFTLSIIKQCWEDQLRIKCKLIKFSPLIQI